MPNNFGSASIPGGESLYSLSGLSTKSLHCRGLLDLSQTWAILCQQKVIKLFTIHRYFRPFPTLQGALKPHEAKGFTLPTVDQSHQVPQAHHKPCKTLHNSQIRMPLSTQKLEHHILQKLNEIGDNSACQLHDSNLFNKHEQTAYVNHHIKQIQILRRFKYAYHTLYTCY